MARNININALLFPVREEPVYLENCQTAISGFKAITGYPNSGARKVFSIVSENYKLVTNKEAISLGKQIHSKLFPNLKEDCFEIFNIIAPDSKSFCHIDIIDKNYTLNIWKQEVYVPFIRIHNSYNKSRSLQFDIGFCRKLCDNGMIFEQNAVNLKFSHIKEAINLKDLEHINVNQLKKLEQEFIKKTKRSTEIEIPRKYFVALAAKTLNKTFNINETNPTKKKIIDTNIEEFTNAIQMYSNRYIIDEKMNETAYAFFNVITDYSSNYEKIQVTSKNGLQTKCGEWINNIDQLITKPDFNWDNELNEYEYLLNNN